MEKYYLPDVGCPLDNRLARIKGLLVLLLILTTSQVARSVTPLTVMSIAGNNSDSELSFSCNSPATSSFANPMVVNVCEGGTTTLTASPGTAYQWDYSADGGITWFHRPETTQTLSLVSVNIAISGYLYSCTVNGGGLPDIFRINVLSLPANTGLTFKAICSGSSPEISLSATISSTFVWTVGTVTGGITGASDGAGNLISQVLTNPGHSSAGTVEYIVTPTSVSGLCQGIPYSIIVTVNPSPVVTTPAATTICSGSATGINLTASIPSTFTWTVGTITGGITGASPGTGSSINQTLTNPLTTLPGTVEYRVTPLTVAGSCSGSPYSILVTVNPSPEVTTPDIATICSESFTNISLTASAASTFTWSVGAITGDITGAGAGTGSSIIQQLTNPGNLVAGTVQYLVTPVSVAGSCSGKPRTVTVDVDPAPVVITPGSYSVCSGSSPEISLSASVPSNFAWTVGSVTGGITGASDGTGNLISQVLTNPGHSSVGTVVYNVVPTTLTGHCKGDNYQITVTVRPSPVVTTLSTAQICSGGTTSILLTSSLPSTYSWTVGTITKGISGASSGSGSSIIQSLTNPGQPVAGTVDYVVTPVSTSGSCSGSPYPITVSVNPTPVITNSVTASMCSGNTTSILLTSDVPSTYSWVVGEVSGGITGSANGSGTTINQTLINPGNAFAGTVNYIVTATALAGSCTGIPITIKETVNPIPVLTSLDPKDICNGTGTNYDLTATTPSNFIWATGTISAGITGASSGSGSTINQVLSNLSTSSPGVVNYLVTPISVAGGCAANSSTIVVTVDPSPVLLTPASKDICSGSGTGIILQASDPTATFGWTVGTITGDITGASSGSGATLNQVLTNNSNTMAGTVQYLVTPTSQGGTCGTFPITVTVNPKPVVTNANAITICSGTNLNLGLNSSLPSTYTWTIGVISGGITGAVSSSGSTINQVLTNPSNTATGSVEYIVTPKSVSNLCSGEAYSITVSVKPKPVVTTASTALICSGENTNIPLSASISSTYSWVLGTITGSVSGASSGSGTSINQVLYNPSSTNPGSVEYIVTPRSSTGLCAGDPYVITVTVNPAPTVTSPANVFTCSGSSPNITLTSSVTSTFSWTVGAITGGITGTNPGIGPTINQVLTNPSTTTAGTVQYIVTPTAESSLCKGSPYYITVTVYPKPVITNSPTLQVCSGSSTGISLVSSTPSTFSWTVGTITGGITGGSLGSGPTINQVLTNPSDHSTGTIEYKVIPTSIAGACQGDPFSITVTVLPSPTITNSNTLSICSGENANISLSASISSNFSWTIGANPSGITGVLGGSGNVINQVLTNPGTTDPGVVQYIITPYSSTKSCTGQPFTLDVTVDPSPIVTTSSTARICSGSSPNINLTASVPSTFTWTVGTVTGGITGALNGSGTKINQVLTNPGNAISGTVEYIIVPTSSSGDCTGAPYSIVVTVDPKPIVTNSSTASVCSGSNTDISLLASTSSTFSWTVGSVTGGITGASAGSGNKISQLLTNPDNSVSGTVQYIVTPTSVNGSCTGTPFTLTVTVNPAPLVTTLPAATTCSGSNAIIVLEASAPSTFSWTLGANAGGITGASAGSGSVINQVLTSPSSVNPGTIEYLVVANSVLGTCNSLSRSISVTVNPAPVITTSATANTCSGTSPNINLTASIASTFSWTVGTITGGITGASAGTGSVINQVLSNPGNVSSGTVQYLVTPRSVAGNCVGPATSITVSVLPRPVLTNSPLFSVCGGSGTNIALEATVPSTYSWTVGTITSGITGSSSGSGPVLSQVLTNPGNSLSGTVAYNITPVSVTGACQGNPATVTATVLPLPIVTSPATVTICNGSSPSIQLTSSVPSTYSWTIGTISGSITGASAGAGSIIDQVLVNPSSSSSGYVEYLVTPVSTSGNCTGIPFKVSVTVLPSPMVTSNSSVITCSGTSPNINLTSSVTSSFNWTIGTVTGGISGAAPGTGASINQLLYNPSPVTSGTVQYIVTPVSESGNCTGVPQVLNVTVNPSPTVTNTSPVKICSGSSANITLTSTIPSTYTWKVGNITGNVTGAASGTGTSISQVLLNSSGINEGSVTYLVTPASIANGCIGETFPITVVVGPLPTLTSSLNPPSICSNSIFSYAPSGTAGASFSWSRSITPGISNPSASGNGNPNEILINTTAAPVSVTYAYSASLNGCVNPAVFNVTVVVAPAPVLSSSLTPSDLCNNSLFDYTPNSATPSTTFSWSRNAIPGILNAAATGTGNPGEVLVNSTNLPINVVYVYTLSAGSCINTQSVAVTVNPSPILTSTLTPPAICSASKFSYIPTSLTAGFGSSWSRAAVNGISNGPSSGTGSPDETLVNTTAFPVLVTYIYKLNINGCSNPVSSSVSVVVNPTPSLTSTLTPLPVCSGSIFSYTPVSSASGTSFSWNRALQTDISNSAANGTNNPNETLVNTSSLPVYVTYKYTLTAGSCANTQDVAVAVNPNPRLTSSLTPPSICSGGVFNYTPTSNTPATTFTWSRSEVSGITNLSASGTGNPNEVLINSTTSPIEVTYIYNLVSGGCSSTQNVQVTVNPVSVLTSTLLPASVCSSSLFSYIPQSSTIGASFGWNRAAVAGISNPAKTGNGNPEEVLINTTSLPVSVTYQYTVSFNGCSNPTQYSVGVVINPTPRLSSTITPPSICNNETFNYVATSTTPGTNYNWSRGSIPGISNAPASGGASVSEMLTNTGSIDAIVNYLFTLSANGCSNNQVVPVTVKPTPVLTSAINPPDICSGTLFSYIPLSSTAGTAFSWTRSIVQGISNGAATGVGNPSEILYNTTSKPVQVTYNYSLSVNGCVNPKIYSVIVTVNPLPTLSSTLAPTSVCSNTVFSYVPISSNGIINGWSRAAVPGISNTPGSGNGSVYETLVNTTSLPVDVIYVFTISSGSCTNMQQVAVTVNPAPKLSGSLSGATVCSSTVFSYTPTSLTPGSQFTWTRLSKPGISNTASSGVGNPNETLVNTSYEKIPVIYSYNISANGCNTTQDVEVVVNPNPVMTSTLLPPPICSTEVFNYNATSPTAGTSFYWTRAAVAGISNPSATGTGNPSETLINLTSSPVSVTYVYSLTANGCTNPVPYNVVVTVLPNATLTSSLFPPAICSGTIFNYSPASISNGIVMAWSRPAVPGISQPASNGSGSISEFLTNSTPLPITVTYQYTLFNSGCANTQNVSVIVNPSPVLTSSTSLPAICSGSRFTYEATSSTPGVSFSWSRVAVAGILEPASSGTGKISETLTNTSGSPVNVTYEYSLVAGSCSAGSSFYVVVAVNPTPPTPVVTVTGPTTVCDGNEVILSAPAGYNYQWSTGAITEGIKASVSGNYSVVVSDLIGCKSSPSANVSVTILPAPAPPVSGGDITQCIDSPAQSIEPAASAPAGCSVKWYDAPAGGNLILAPSFSGLGTKLFFAESYNILTGCTSLIRTQVKISIIIHPVPPVVGPDIVECEKSPLQTLTATASAPFGCTIKWYSAPAGGLPVSSPTLNSVGTVSYYAESDNGYCASSSRTKISLTINPAPLIPVSLGNIVTCEESPIQTLTAKSSDPSALWFTTPLGGSPVNPVLNKVGSATYYAESTLGACSSLTRSAPVVLTIHAVPDAPVSKGDIRQCEQYPLQTLTAVATPPPGCTVNWYLAPTGGVPVSSPTLNAIKDVTYYAESDNGNCKSFTRTAVKLQIDAAPNAPTPGLNITECQTFPIQTLTATATSSGASILWYATAAGGEPVNPVLNQVGTASYYAEANNGSCNSVARSNPVVLTIKPTPASPVAIDITECPKKPIQTITAQVVANQSGIKINWYNGATGGTTVASPILKTIGSRIYYAESEFGNCVNPIRTPVKLQINSEVALPVLKADGADTIETCETNPVTVLNAEELFDVLPGTSLVFYDASVGGFEVSSTLNYPGTKKLYVAARDVSTHCESFERIPVWLVINAAPSPPASKGDLFECSLKPLQTLDANSCITPVTGSSVVWYSLAKGGIAVSNPSLNRTNTTVVYYAESVDNKTKCSSLTRTAVKLTLGSTTASAASNSPLSLGQTLLLKGGPDLPGNTYMWTDPNGFNFFTIDVTIPNVTEAAAGIYRLTVSSPNGCKATDSVRVTLDIARAEAQLPVCVGSTLYLSGFPDNMKSYSWSGPNGFTSTDQNPSINNAGIVNIGVYTLIVTNSNNATSSDTVSVTLKPLPIPIAEAGTLCPSGIMQLKAGPNGMTSYTWSDQNGSTWNQQNPPAIPFPNPPQAFKLTVVDWNGCEASKTITPTPFKPTVTSNSPLCPGDTLRLRGEPNGMASYKWSGPNGFTSNLQSPVINNVSPATVTGEYTLTVVDQGGCTSSEKHLVSFNPAAPVPTISPSLNPICAGSTLVLNGGPNGMASYEWTGPDGFVSSQQSPQITDISSVKAGRYSLRITSPTGCKNQFETDIVVYSAVVNGTYGPYCLSDSPVTLSVSPAGGVFSGPGVSGDLFSPKTAGIGTHTIHYTLPLSGGLCSLRAAIYIDVVSVPSVVTHKVTLRSCSGVTADITQPSVTAGSTPGLVFSYWTDANATNMLSSPKAVSAGNYFIKGATPSGSCFNIKPVIVEQPDSLQGNVVVTSVLNCAGDSTGVLTANISLGTAPFTYQWNTSPSQSTVSASNLPAGKYKVIVTDAKMCRDSLFGEITDPDPIRMGFSTKPIQCASDVNGSARVDTINGITDVGILNSYKYVWGTTPAQSTREAVRLTAWWQKLTLISPNGCIQKDSVFIDVLDSIPPTIVCPKDVDLVVPFVKSEDGSPNRYTVDLGKALASDNCTVDTIRNDAPEKFRTGVTYVIWTVTDQVGLTDTCTQRVNIREIPVIPQLVTPNGDGLNDRFVVEGLNSIDFQNTQMSIFTRSGQLVFQSPNYELSENAWDGRYSVSTFAKNTLVAPGVYYYILKLGGLTNHTMKGYVYVYY